ncbi:MAG: hypothetical protein IJS69_00120 [Selenomonadaceae bacterium]|nr:hypothetical protein [Selenomonadaceae bacterium]
MELNLLIDTNVALDIVLEREPFFETSAKVISLTEVGVNEFVSATRSRIFTTSLIGK